MASNIPPGEKKRMMKTAAYLIFHEGQEQKVVAKLLGVSENTMTAWVRQMKAAGMNTSGTYKDSISAFMAYILKKDSELHNAIEKAYNQFLKQL